ncbi:MAG: pantetheine-phosphate adenylyltransferase [Anaerolineae bacterium]|nr:pantetheine-phosphate adenylyltransferase [Anaerolineae bacterium]
MRRAVFPGTFDPIHYGHIDIATRAAQVFDEVVVAVYDQPQKNVLFNVEARYALVKEALADSPNIKVAKYSGLTVDYVKQIGALAIVRGLRVFSDFELEFRMAIANRRLAPDVEMVNFITDEKHIHISSSTVREIASLGGDVSSMVPPHVEAKLKAAFAALGDDGPGSVDMVSLRD